MVKTVLLMRHAKSDWNSGVTTDFERPLNARGERDIPKMAHWMALKSLVPDVVLASPARRAKITTERVCDALGISRGNIEWRPEIYEASTGTLVEIVKQLPGNARISLIVGHNPGMEQVVRYFCGEVPVPGSGNLMPTAAIAWLSFGAQDGYSKGAALQHIARPKEIPDN